VVEGILTLTEVETTASLDDCLRANAVIDLRHAQEEAANKPQGGA